ncbi:MAG: hypothetical protein KAT34_05025 [Candidatus Aminicenantes bacterium]|nr:hypothetical protein [Candidatus Aminicenantes bacterium]
MAKQEKIKELLELMNIPEFEKLINIKIEELKIILSKKVNLYYKLKNEFKGVNQEGLHLLENGSLDRSKQTFFFELNRIEDMYSKIGYQWILKKIEPEPDVEIEDIIPSEVITMIGRHKTNPTKIEFNKFYSKKLEKKFDIKSIKYNDSRVFGTIRTLRENKKTGDYQLKDKGDTITLDVHREERETEKKYTELFRYMEKYPEIKEHIFTYFYMIQKPVIDNAEEMSKNGLNRVTTR